jgi:hypothetical protein
MSNPLLRPDDRFQPKQIAQPDGSNPFSEGDGVLEAESSAPARGDHSFAPPSSTAERPFVPQYETSADHRGVQLLALTGIAGVAALAGLAVSYIGWVLPVLGAIPAGTVIFLAADDLRTMKLGGRNREGRPFTILALVLSIVIEIVIALMSYAFFTWELRFLPPWIQ